MNPGKPILHGRVRAYGAGRPGRIELKPHQTIGGRKACASEPVMSGKVRLNMGQRLAALTFHIGGKPTIAQTSRRKIGIHQKGQEDRSFSSMHPFQKTGAIGIIRRGMKSVVRVKPGKQPLCDGPGFGDDCSVFLDQHRRLSQRVNRSKRRGRQPGLRIALVADQLIGRTQLLHQPDDPFGPGPPEVMQCDRHDLADTRQHIVNIRARP